MPDGHRAVSVLYQGLLTGLVLTLVTRRGEDEAAEFIFRLFRRQYLAATFARYLAALARAQGEEVEIEVAAGRTVIREPIRGPAST
ncbi:MAG TPA: hypothetical protein VFS98_12505 [Methylomirabilota bacterium]|nr:hypothetical protein [Methylomirabilota bacterium]